MSTSITSQSMAPMVSYDEQLSKLFYPGESPYMNMYIAGIKGIPLEIVGAYLQKIRVAIRQKDIDQWKAGFYRSKEAKDYRKLNPASILPDYRPTPPVETLKLSDFQMFPDEWKGIEKRFFPCTPDNRPMRKWGWKDGFIPELYDMQTARSLSPCGWVGQNMLYQRFVVLDIDGAGHGCIDEDVIRFGSLFKSMTLTLEDPNKPGSFHLYFETDRLIPVKHFPHAKIDFMGNAVNAAVYFKNKVPNGKPMAKLTEGIWSTIIAYQSKRKGESNG